MPSVHAHAYRWKTTPAAPLTLKPYNNLSTAIFYSVLFAESLSILFDVKVLHEHFTRLYFTDFWHAIDKQRCNSEWVCKWLSVLVVLFNTLYMSCYFENALKFSLKYQKCKWVTHTQTKTPNRRQFFFFSNILRIVQVFHFLFEKSSLNKTFWKIYHIVWYIEAAATIIFFRYVFFLLFIWPMMTF